MTVRAVTLRAGAALAVATLAALPLVGIANAAPAADRDCGDFPTQAAAQAAMLPGDPDGLDRNKNGIACEDFEYGSGGTGTPGTAGPRTSTPDIPASTGTSSGSAQVGAVPSGSVDAGDGSGSADPGADVAGVVALGGIGAVAATGAVATSLRRRPSSR